MIKGRPYRVLLIKPKHNECTGHAFPPLGVMYLAACVRREPDVDVRIIDMAPWPMRYADLDHQIRSYGPDLVGISAITFESRGLHRAARLVKQWRSDVPVIAGGPHATSYTHRVLEDTNIDAVVIGEGEITFEKLIDALRHGQPLSTVAGIGYRDGDAVRLTVPREPIKDLDALPLPAYDLVPVDRYKHFSRMSKFGCRDYGVLFTSRGCPYACVYCHNIFGKAFRTRSPENVFAEIRTLRTHYGLREFEVLDDAFNLDRSRMQRICEMIIASGMDITLTFPNGVRADLLDEESIIKLRQAGTRFMSIAVETASPRLQKLIGKNLNLPKVRRNMELALKHGIFCQGFFMLGFPSETEEELRGTIDFALESDLHAAHFFTVNAFDGTPLAEWARRIGKPTKTDFARSYLTRDFENLTDIRTEKFNRMRSQALRRFWLSPRRVYRIVRDYPSKQNLPYFVPTLLKRLALWGQGH